MQATPEPVNRQSLPALQLREQEFQLSQSRVGRSRVEKSLALAVQVTLRLGHIIERELDRLVDRRHQRTVVRRHVHRRGMVDASVVLHGPHDNPGAHALKARR